MYKKLLYNNKIKILIIVLKKISYIVIKQKIFEKNKTKIIT
jgi:hypothetical protein